MQTPLMQMKPVYSSMFFICKRSCRDRKSSHEGWLWLVNWSQNGPAKKKQKEETRFLPNDMYLKMYLVVDILRHIY